jgi:Lon-like ATP-dependent protease
MYNIYRDEDYKWIKELMLYPQTLEKNLSYFKDTSQIAIPEDPIEKVIFQDKAKKAIRKVAQNRGHLLLVGKQGTGKSMLADMFNYVIDKSLGDYIRPRESIVAYPGKDQNHMRVAYASPEKIENHILMVNQAIEGVKNSIEEFSLDTQINSVRKVKIYFYDSALSIIAGFSFLLLLLLPAYQVLGPYSCSFRKTITRCRKNTAGNFSSKSANMKHITDMVPKFYMIQEKIRT